MEHNATASDATTVLGIELDASHHPAVATLQYVALNLLVSSIVPIPLQGALVAVAALMFGLVGGMAISVVSSTVGSYLALLLTRSACRPYFLRCLGRKRAAKWAVLDTALVADGPVLALLLRLTPIAPHVVLNIVLSLTSISQFHYVWTTFVGIIPASLPYAYAAVVGMSMYEEFPPKDPVMLVTSVLGLAASIAVALKLGRVHRIEGVR